MADKELKHYGVLGMHWGIRRYQPYSTVPRQSGKGGEEVGEARKKTKLDRISDARLYRTLKKDIRSKRADIYGGSNRWAHSHEIGEKSKQLRAKKDEEWNKYINSDEYKQYLKKWDQLEKEFWKRDSSGKYSPDEIDEWYEQKSHELWKSRPAEPNGNLKWAVSYDGTGKKYLNDFLTNGGKDLSIARLQDLGYDEAYAQKLTERLIKYGRSLGDI